MTVAGPWSVKGIDPKAKELAKDLARRSGMTLGEWLNQMIIEGGGEAEAPPLEDFTREAPREPAARDNLPRDTSERRRLLDDLYNEATRRSVERGPASRDAGRQPAPYSEPTRRPDGGEIPKITQALEALSHRIEAAEHRSTLAISGIDQSVMGVLSRLDDLDREQTTVASHLEGAVDDVRDTQAKVIERLRHMEKEDGSRVEAMKALELALGRLASHLNDGSARAEAASTEARQDLEALARRVNKVEAAADGGAETRTDLERARSELDTLTRRMSKVEASTESAPNVFAAAGTTTEALDGLVRRVSRVEAAADAAPASYAEFGQTQEALDTLARRVARVEATGEAAPEAYANAAQTQDELDAVARRLGRVETAVDAAPSAYADAEKVETVLMHMAERLERAEARTTSAVQSLEASFAGLDARIRTTEARVGRDGQISAEFDRRFQGLAAELSQQVEASRAELTHKLRTVGDSRIDGIETQLRDLAGHLDQSEKRSAQAIDRMGREVVTIAQSLGERVTQTETRTSAAVEHIGGEMARIADAMEGRLQRADTTQAEALEKLGGEIARIAERLTERLSNSDRRSAEAMDEVTDKVGRMTEGFTRQQDAHSSDLSDRIRQSEERTAKLLDEARAKLDQGLADVQKRAEAAPVAYRPVYSPTPLPPVAYVAPTSALYNEPELSAPATNADPFGMPDPMFEPQHQESARAEPVDQMIHEPVADLPPTARAAVDVQDRSQPETAVTPPAPTSEPQLGGAFHADAFADHGDFDDGDFSAFDATDDFQAFTPAHAAHVERHVERHIEQHEADEPPLAPVDSAPASFAPASFEDDFRDDFGMAPEVEPSEALEIEAPEAEPRPSVGFSVRDFQPTTTESPPQSSTRDMIEAARAAARRAAAGGREPGPSSVPIPPLETLPPSGNKPFGMTFLGRKKKESGGPTLRTMILASGWAAAITAATVGAYHISHDGTGGQAVARPQLAGMPGAPTAAVAAASPGSSHGPSMGPSTGTSTGTSSVTPELAVALTPSFSASAPPTAVRKPGPIDLGAGPNATTLQTSRALYDNAAQRIEAGDLTGVASLRRAANLGYGPAQFYLGRLYEAGGGGMKKDLSEARRWTERAAQSGEPTAMYNLASYLYAGEGGPKDPTAAADWFHRAADRGVVNSQFNLAQLYEKGYGVPLNPVEAYKWYLVAAAAGDPEAQTSAEALRRKLSPEAQNAAERSATILHAQAVGAARAAARATAATQPTLPGSPTSAQSSVQVAASAGH
jgi:localization factor PodJL